MEPTMGGHEAIDHDDLAVHSWRAAQLTWLRIPGSLAEVYADHLDWHQMLVQGVWGAARRKSGASCAATPSG